MDRMILSIIRNMCVVLVLITISTAASYGRQSDPSEASLKAKYNEMVENAETYEKYKVIATTKLNSFWGEVNDSLATVRSELANAKLATSAIDQSLKAAKDSLVVVNEKLTASEEVNSEIGVLGLSLDKSFYNVVVWGLIGALLIIMGVLYVAFKNSHSVTSRAKKDLIQVTEELEDLRHRSNEKQVKLKRELQTALNQIDEMRRKVPAGR